MAVVLILEAGSVTPHALVARPHRPIVSRADLTALVLGDLFDRIVAIVVEVRRAVFAERTTATASIIS